MGIKDHVAMDVAAKLISAETSIDETLEQTLLLGVSMVRARGRLNLPIGAGASAFHHLGEATTAAYKMRRHLCGAHAGLRQECEGLGIDVHLGPVADCPDKDAAFWLTAGIGSVEEASSA